MRRFLCCNLGDLTRHARDRAQERGFLLTDFELIRRFGWCEPAPGRATRYVIRALDAWHWGQWWPRLADLTNAYVIVSDNDTFITIGVLRGAA